MLTRLYIDNFRCFEKFEWRPGRKALILGRNGTGKTSLMECVQQLVGLAAGCESAANWFQRDQRSRGLNQSTQRFELDLEFAGRSYSYSVITEAVGEPARMEIRHQGVTTGTEAPPRNGSANNPPAGLSEALARISCFRLNPDGEESFAEHGGVRAFPAWYRPIAQAQPEQNTAFLQDLRESLACFETLHFDTPDLRAVFRRAGAPVEIPFAELSDGQRCLMCLYAIVHFVVAQGGTIILDEPDNFISLREIQPWLMAIDDMADDHGGQMILISHHPEILNQWANPYGAHFVREDDGPVRVEKFRPNPEYTLTAAELVARGWERD